ncbi:hypothetical protein PUR71_28920 [Streptomyces sp. SP17BM10]|uniref:hypothetical protein n=1 Tax=Streptomyces sp. SP17BM10 TaxID=3002530 RepID=UPI002E79F282|nr:hypothetical protein [Streptomyces sp. SP17BM10]MEE1786897.1 hypothetical protein [Streptomyces sp. SP17BM10]
MQKRYPSSAFRSGMSGGALVRRRALLGTAVLVVLVVLAGVFSYLTRDSRSPSPNPSSVQPSSPSAAASVPVTPSTAPGGGSAALPGPPDTRDPIAFGKAAAVALWSYDTRAYSQPELVAALHRWLTTEGQYVDAESVERQVPSPLLWGRMADSGQFATATAAEAHFPESFTRALQADPGAITQAYVYAVTVSGKQSISWNGAPQGGAEDRSATLAVQCRPDRPCALVGVMPSVAP